MQSASVTWCCAVSKALPESGDMSDKEARGSKEILEGKAVFGHSSSIANPHIMAFNE